MTQCKAIQQSDEMFCAACGLRWDVNDMFPPECRPAPKRMVIGITGPAGAGKSTLAAYMSIAYGFERLDMALPLKMMLWELIEHYGPGDADRWVFGDKKDSPCPVLGHQSPRYAMQTLGTEWGRDCISTDLWVNTARNQIAATTSNVVIENIRFDNEAALCDRIIRITDRGGIEGEHSSENGVRRWDVSYSNVGTVCDMHAWFDYVAPLLEVRANTSRP